MEKLLKYLVWLLSGMVVMALFWSEPENMNLLGKFVGRTPMLIWLIWTTKHLDFVD